MNLSRLENCGREIERVLKEEVLARLRTREVLWKDRQFTSREESSVPHEKVIDDVDEGS